MKFQGALIREQGVEFAVIVVKSHVLNSQSSSQKAIQSFQPVFPGIPIVLMAQDNRGTPKYFGRNDIVKFLANVPLNAIPWKEYTVS